MWNKPYKTKIAIVLHRLGCILKTPSKFHLSQSNEFSLVLGHYKIKGFKLGEPLFHISPIVVLKQGQLYQRKIESVAEINL